MERIVQVGKDPKSGHPNSAVEILRYWLNAFQVETIEKKRNPNIAIVLTHKDVIEATKENPEEYIQNYIGKILEQAADYPEFVTRENIYVVDNKTGAESDFEKLRSQLLVHLTKQGTWGMKMPLPWLKLKADIIKKGNEMKRKYLDLQEVEDLALQYGMKENDVQSFLQKQNILGDFIFYSDSELNDNVIIDPQWLVGMCSALITTNEFLEKKNHLKKETIENLKIGRATENGLEDIWQGDEVDFMKNLMIKFDLLVDISAGPDKEYLIQCMLPSRDKQFDHSQPYVDMERVYDALHKQASGDRILIGSFHQLLSKCSKVKNWKLCADPQENPLSYTDVSFNIPEGMKLVLTLSNKGQLRSRVWCLKSLMEGDQSGNEAFYKETRETLSAIMKTCRIAQYETFEIHCPRFDPSKGDACLVKMKEYIHPTPEIVTYDYDVKTDKCPVHEEPLPSKFPSLLMLAAGMS